MKTIHQIVAGFANSDAISNEAIVFQEIFRKWGYTSEIFSERKRILPELRDRAKDISDLSVTQDDVVLLHLSIGSSVNDIFPELLCKKVILYHNVTPSHYFDLINKKTAAQLAKGRKQVQFLSGTADVTMADSKFNAGELESAGYTNVQVLPLALNFGRLQESTDLGIIRKFSDGLKNILFVGRCAPNKRIEDLIDVFACYQKNVEPRSRLIHVGSYAGTERYYGILAMKTKQMGLNNVYFAGSVPQNELNAFYKCADAFLCMSEHEGFCIPLIESMVHKVPILAYASAAVPETLDGSGILMDNRNFEMGAEMLGRITSDDAFRKAIVDGQNQRLKRYRERDIEAELKQHFSPLL